MVASWLIAILKLPQCRRSARGLDTWDMRRQDGFVFMARSLKWFQTRFRKRMVSRFTLQRKKTRGSGCCSFPRLFFRV